LFDFEDTHPDLEPVIKCLLRTYEGIYDNKVSISEKLVARLTKTSVEDVKQQLQQLQSFHIIDYTPQKDTPQIYFVTNRAPAQYLVIDYERYKQRKTDFTKRVETMLLFMRETQVCRSKFIGSYFGDVEINDCGICDNCLKRKSGEINEQEFILIKEKILSTINNGGTSIQNILDNHRHIKKEKLWFVLNYLQSERIITIGADGNVSMPHPG
jgi:ATP-dependent DNA helicase RecQ